MTPPTVLVVDDDAGIVSVLAMLLEDEGYAVVVARNGREGLDTARRVQPTVVLSDIMMPGMTGIELCCAIQRDAALQHTPVVLMSAATNRGAADACSFAAFIPKPFALHTILVTVDALTASP